MLEGMAARQGWDAHPRRRQADRPEARRRLDQPGAGRAVRALGRACCPTCTRRGMELAGAPARGARGRRAAGPRLRAARLPPARRRATQMPWMPKGRYAIMRRYMPTVGALGLDMMLRTCTVQVEPRLRRRGRHGGEAARLAGAAAGGDRAVRQLALHRRQAERLPLACARRSGPTPTRPAPASPRWCSSRASASSASPNGCSTCRCISSCASGKWLDAAGASASAPSSRAALATRCAGERATMGDFADHVTTAFTDVRLKRFLEMRGADAGSPDDADGAARRSGSGCSTTTRRRRRRRR